MSIKYVRPNRGLLDSNEQDLFMDDYFCEPSIVEARKLTDKIFSENSDFIAHYDYEGYKVTWSWYDTIFQSMLNYLEIKPLIDKLESLDPSEIILIDIPNNYAKVIHTYFYNVEVKGLKKISFFEHLREFIFNSILLFFSCVSIIFFYFRKGTNTATRTEDLVFDNTKSDFRLGHLYKKYKENNIQYIEFVRNTSIKFFFVNLYKRKKFAIYYTSIIYFVKLFAKKENHFKKTAGFFDSMLFTYHDPNIILIKSIPLFKRILKILKIKNFVIISFSSRVAHLAFASKSLKIPLIGIMHGLTQKEYDVQEFLESYNEDKKIGCDVFGLWSEYYLDYFKKYSKITALEGFQCSGLLRPVNNSASSTKFNRILNKKIKVLLLTETQTNVHEVIPYIKCLLEHDDIELAVKVRPMVRDKDYQAMQAQFPEINKLKVLDGKIEDVGKDFDVFIGTRSTAVIEASLIGKISLLLYTKRFGDYFDIDTLIYNQPLLIRRPDDIYSKLIFRVSNEKSLDTISKTKNRFFGDNKDGSQWIIDQIT